MHTHTPISDNKLLLINPRFPDATNTLQLLITASKRRPPAVYVSKDARDTSPSARHISDSLDLLHHIIAIVQCDCVLLCMAWQKQLD